MIKRLFGRALSASSGQGGVFTLFLALCGMAISGEFLREGALDQAGGHFVDLILLLSYRILQLVFMSYAPEDNLHGFTLIARVGLPLCVSWTLIRGFMNTFTARHSSLWLRWTHFRHVVIYGLSPQSLELVQQLRRTHPDVNILLVCSNESQYFGNRHLAGKRLKLLVNQSSLAELFKSVAIHRARTLYVFEGTDSEKIHLLNQLDKYLQHAKAKGSSLVVPTFFDRTYDHQLIVDSFDIESLFTHERKLVVIPMNWRSEGSRKVLTDVATSPDGLSYKRLGMLAHPPKFAILGQGKTLQTFLLQTLLHAHYQADCSTTIHVIPTIAGDLDQWVSEVCPFVRSPSRLAYTEELFPNLQIDNPVDGVPLDGLRDLLERNEIDTLYVCLARFDEALDLLVSASRLGLIKTLDVVIVHESVTDDLERFDLNCRSLQSQSLTVLWAQFASSENPEKMFPGHDLDEMAWTIHREWPHPCEYTQWARESSRMSASHYAIKERFFEARSGLSFNLNHFDQAPQEISQALAKIEHRRWSTERLIYGWRLPSDGQRDNKQRLHPDLLPFQMLPQEVQQKDVDAIRALLSAKSKKG